MLEFFTRGVGMHAMIAKERQKLEALRAKRQSIEEQAAKKDRQDHPPLGSLKMPILAPQRTRGS
jgi:hypothetical protein